ncbi:MAG: hypothetical protein QOC38_01995 [Nitrososphaeraceae archaeon]|nr:hypothetical protein [Nitrososphaeraceae archaeon]MDW0274115.1 hypothetical protein [Nitrososphaeraceae archaeon]
MVRYLSNVESLTVTGVSMDHILLRVLERKWENKEEIHRQVRSKRGHKEVT